jgi:hypothetical protein
MPNQELILLTHVSTESVNDGFLLAVLLTDQAEPEPHRLGVEYPRIGVVYQPTAIQNPLKSP